MGLLSFIRRLFSGAAPKAPEWSLPPDPIVIISAEPDTPSSFGYKTSWFAIRSDDAEKVVAALELADVRPANWATGVARAYQRDLKSLAAPFPVFVTPPVQGWVLAMAAGWPEVGYPETPNGCRREFEELVLKLAAEFREFQFFATHRIVGYDAWIKVGNGAIERAFCYVGESGKIYTNFGPQTVAERALGLADLTGLDCDQATERLSAEMDDEELDPEPDEGKTMALAGAWSIDPTKFEEMDLPAGRGWIGYRAPIGSD